MATTDSTQQAPQRQRRFVAAGQRYGRLITVRRSDKTLSSGRRMPAWLCVCDCQTETTVLAMYLPNGHTKSCGCLARELASARAKTHGATKTPEYSIWAVMIQRCHREYSEVFKHYGGRGISVCDRWRYGDGERGGFECFIADVGFRPDPSLTIDRRDNNGNYEPGNVRWATWVQQASNKRPAKPRGPDKRPRKRIVQATHCRRGHPLSAETSYTQKGRLRCKECHARRVRAYRERKRKAGC